MNRNNFISIKLPEGSWIRRWVDEDTYMYIRALESAIIYPELLPQIREHYPRRFKEKKIMIKRPVFYDPSED